ERFPIYSSPRLGLDGAGNVWLSYRQKIFAAFGTPPGTNWLTVARRLEGNQWSPGIDVQHSDGLLDSRPVLLQDGMGGRVIANTDGRDAMPTKGFDNQIYLSRLSLPGAAPEPKLAAHEPGKKDGARAAEEGAAVAAIRGYALEHHNKSHRLLRG